MTYLFLAIPNYCGSTLVHNILATSDNVAPLTYTGNNVVKNFIEGYIITPEAYHSYPIHGYGIDSIIEEYHTNENNMNWFYIKTMWDNNWNRYYPTSQIRLQKTPQDIFRINIISKYFNNIKWILSVKNPYLYATSIIKERNIRKYDINIEHICYHIIRVMEVQKQNIESLGNSGFFVSYEDFISNPQYHCDKISKWLPEIGKINVPQTICVKNNISKPISYNYEDRINDILKNYPSFFKIMNEYFESRKDLFEYFGYEIGKGYNTPFHY